MPTFSAADGTRLAYRVLGRADSGRADGVGGPPVVCVPGGPTDSRYLGDLGGLSAHRRLIMPDPRGTGESAIPDDTSSYRCDRLVEDVEALRTHLGIERLDLLGHSAGTNIATQYVARYPANVGALALIGPSTRAVGIAITGQTRRDVARLRQDEPWFPAAFAALTAITKGTGGDAAAIAPFYYARWDTVTRQHHATSQPVNTAAVATFGADGAFDPAATRAALATCPARVLLLTGEFDLNSPPSSTAEFAGLFPDATLVVQPGAGHYLWLDDADRFVTATTAFLG